MTKDALVCIVNERLDDLANRLGVSRKMYFLRFCGMTIWIDRSIDLELRLGVHEALRMCEQSGLDSNGLVALLKKAGAIRHEMR